MKLCIIDKETRDMAAHEIAAIRFGRKGMHGRRLYRELSQVAYIRANQAYRAGMFADGNKFDDIDLAALRASEKPTFNW